MQSPGSTSASAAPARAPTSRTSRVLPTPAGPATTMCAGSPSIVRRRTSSSSASSAARLTRRALVIRGVVSGLIAAYSRPATKPGLARPRGLAHPAATARRDLADQVHAGRLERRHGLRAHAVLTAQEKREAADLLVARGLDDRDHVVLAQRPQQVDELAFLHAGERRDDRVVALLEHVVALRVAAVLGELLLQLVGTREPALICPLHEQHVGRHRLLSREVGPAGPYTAQDASRKRFRTG